MGEPDPCWDEAGRTPSPTERLAGEALAVDLLPADQVMLVGRETDMTRLTRLLTQSDGYAGVMLTGPSGVGKTRLATEAIAALHTTHQVIRVMATWPGQDLPYASLICSARDRQAGTWTTVDGPAHELLRAVHSGSSGRRGTLLFLDDAHLVDPCTAAFMLELARRRTARLLLTINTELPAPEAVTHLWTDDHLQRMELGPLDAAATRRLAAALLGEPLAHSASTHLAQLSDGNPLLLRELARAAAQQHLFRPSPAGWTLPDRLPISAPLCELITRKVTHLSAAAREALELVVLAEPAPLQLLERLVAPDVLLLLEDQELIRVETPPTAPASVRLFHPLVGYVIRQSLPILRRRAHLRTWIAAYTVRWTATVADTLRITEWRMEVGDDSVSEGELLQAAHHAAGAQDLRAAARFTAAAWQQHPAPHTAAAHALSLVALADFPAAGTVLDTADAAAHSEPHQDILAVRARSELLQGHFESADGTISQLTGNQGKLYASMAAYFQGHFDRTLTLCQPLTKDPADPHHLEAVIFRMAALLHAGRPRDALTLYESTRSCSDTSAFHADSLEELHAVTLADLGRLSEAVDLLTRAYERAVADRRVRIDAQRGIALGTVLLERGRPRQALELFALHPAYQVGWQQWHDRARICTAMADAALGRITKTSLPALMPSHFLLQNHVAHAWNTFLSGDRDQAADLLGQAAQISQAHGAHADVAIAAHELARLGMAEHSKVYWDTPVQGSFLQGRLDYAHALATDNPRLLRSAAAAFAQAGADIYAAEAYAELARLYRRVAQHRAATAATLKAKTLAERCDGAVTPALLQLQATERLSLRERELVLLVAQGFTDKEIAERLTLSVRTVSNHLYRIYRKVGVANRRELQRVAATSPEVLSQIRKP
ncbi:LuxR C-terminal-related transcriptional regulator [Streptomyces sp. NPDC048419]|uniref:LuxR C-terminal-related transcriptional regulator n=1 Tax=Streptomyces sp. NPDC048419 TaxID=3365547 RepID=UPI003714D68F